MVIVGRPMNANGPQRCPVDKFLIDRYFSLFSNADDRNLFQKRSKYFTLHSSGIHDCCCCPSFQTFKDYNDRIDIINIRHIYVVSLLPL